MPIFKKKSDGITIVEVLFILFIFSLIVISIYSLFAKGNKYIVEAKRKTTAVSIANERMEIVRSLNYDQIGISGSGYINGDIPSADQITVGGQTFYIFSLVAYIDDSYDGLEGEDPNDDRPADYKRVTIKVAWENNPNSKKSTTIVSDFAPPGVEENISGGTLVVKVLNKDSQGITDFNVHIINTDLSIDENLVTDSNGGISLPGLPVDGNDYEISISKNDYFSINTLPPYPISSFLPVYAHASVTDGAKNIFSIVTDRVSDLTLSTKDFFGEDIPNVSYNLKGGIRMGDTIDDPPDNPTEPIYYYNENLNSGAGGENEIDDISYGDYIFTFSDAVSEYEFVKMIPSNATVKDKTRFYVEPGCEVEQSAVFAKKSINSILITVLDSNESSPIEGASVRLYNLSLPEPYDVTLTTDEFGMVYFPENMPELAASDYNIDVQADAYTPKTDISNISGYTKKEVLIDLI